VVLRELSARRAATDVHRFNPCPGGSARYRLRQIPTSWGRPPRWRVRARSLSYDVQLRFAYEAAADSPRSKAEPRRFLHRILQWRVHPFNELVRPVGEDLMRVAIPREDLEIDDAVLPVSLSAN